MVVSIFQRVPPLGSEVSNQHRFIYLHPLHTQRCQLIEQLGIDREQGLQQVKLVAAVFAFAQPQIRHRADDDRLGLDRLGVDTWAQHLLHLIHQARSVQ